MTVRLPQFSEFSFGFALTENLMNGSYFTGVRGAPTFPSLFAEGKAGGGYDVRIPRRGAPVYLQFKIPQIVTRGSKNLPPGFTTPYYRIHLVRRRHSLQHEYLLTHARRGRLVYYAAPFFHTITALNHHYEKKEVPLRTAFITPKAIGYLTDEPHHVAYMDGSPVGWLYSEPLQLEGEIASERFFADLAHAVDAAEPRENDERFFTDIGKDIVRTTQDTVLRAEQWAREQTPRQRDTFSPSWQEGYEEAPRIRAERVANQAMAQFQMLLERFDPAIAAGYMARFYLDCELLIMGTD